MRLVTRSDFDGLVCAALLVEAGVVDSYTFVHPRDIQNGLIELTENDVLANVPYGEGCGLWFDHHSSEAERLALETTYQFMGESRVALSCARVIFDYYGGEETFPHFVESGLMEAIDDCDSGQFTKDDILDPEGWVLLNFIIDPRTGLARFKDYRIANYQLMENLIEELRTKKIIDILQNQDIKERVVKYFSQEEEYEAMIQKHATVHENILVINLLDCAEIKTGNRFKEYVLFPEKNISVRVLWGLKQQNVALTCGHSIFNRTSKTDIGSLMLKYDGGGHWFAGTCQVEASKWQESLQEIIAIMNQDEHQG